MAAMVGRRDCEDRSLRVSPWPRNKSNETIMPTPKPAGADGPRGLRIVMVG